MPFQEDKGETDVPNLLSFGNAAHSSWTARRILKIPLGFIPSGIFCAVAQPRDYGRLVHSHHTKQPR